MVRASGWLVAIGLVALTGCRAAPPVATSSADNAPVRADVTYGRIVAVRPAAAAGKGVSANVQRSILQAVGGRPGDALRGPEAEFVVREDDGQAVALVQGTQDGFRVGDRVLVTRDPPIRLARP